MALSVKIDVQEYYLHYVIEGEFEAKPDPPFLVDVMAQCRQHDLYYVLVDVRGMENYPSEVSLLEMYDETLRAHDIFLKFDQQPIRMAVLTQAKNLSQPHPGERFSEGNALAIMATDDEKTAIDWLLNPQMVS